MPDTNDINERYELELQKAIARSQRQIRKVYEDAILDIAILAGLTDAKEKAFSLSLYPNLERRVEARIKKMHKSILRLISGSVKDSWQLSNEKNNLFVDRRLKGRKKLPQKVRLIFYDPNEGALNSFLSRKEKGLNLSDRVWNLLEPFKHEMEQAIGLEIAQGTPAPKMATKFKQYLNEPDKLFRRVRGEDGKLRLSKKAREYKPGQGVYRSSYKNALRLSATEVNTSYRLNDINRWQKLEFIKGYRIVLSNSHKTYDICDELNKSIYPKDMVWSGWHPFCKCHMEPVMISDEQYSKLEDYLLGVGEKPDISYVSEPPKVFTDYVQKNEERIRGWKQPPYWYRDNKKFVSS
jgi:hypothetical protein